MLSKLSSVELTPREEMLFAASYLEKVQVSAAYFSDSTFQRYERVAQFLKEIPTAWALEICKESLLHVVGQQGCIDAD